MVRKPPWPLSIDACGLASGPMDTAATPTVAMRATTTSADDTVYDEDPWLSHLVNIDALLDRTLQVLAGAILRARVAARLLPLAAGYKVAKYWPAGRETPT
jgi:hypothetical protein